MSKQTIRPTVQRANRRLWVEALRSGRYQQGGGALRETLKAGVFHCCLGVLADIAGCVWDEDDDADGNSGLAPLRAMQFVGMRESCGAYILEGQTEGHQLTEDNDRGLTFDQIAAIIESEPEGLFNKKRGRKKST